ncbi:MAG: hypothetical protein VKL60_19425 [Sphaerospermopsis sp.]|nr:hypothetical protein [Sphaerospermopsis sp.]
MKFTPEEAKLTISAYEKEVNKINFEISQLEREKQELLDERSELYEKIDEVTIHTEVVDAEKSFSELVALWQSQPEVNKDRFFDEIIYDELFFS